VSLLVEANAAPASGGSQYVSAFIDPMFTAPAGYSIELSPGVGNSLASATPLPSTWLMLLGGLVGLGFIAHCGSKNGSTAFATA